MGGANMLEERIRLHAAPDATFVAAARLDDHELQFGYRRHSPPAVALGLTRAQAIESGTPAYVYDVVGASVYGVLYRLPGGFRTLDCQESAGWGYVKKSRGPRVRRHCVCRPRRVEWRCGAGHAVQVLPAGAS